MVIIKKSLQCGFPRRFDCDFLNNVQRYLNGGFRQDGERINASKPPTDLQELIVNSAESVQRFVCFSLTEIYL